MKDLTITVPDNKYEFTVNLVKSLKFVKKVKTNEPADKAPTKAEFLKNLAEAVEDVNQIKAGKKKGILFKDFLNEL